MCEPVSADFAIIVVIIYYHLLGVGEDSCFGVMLLSDASVTQIKTNPAAAAAAAAAATVGLEDESQQQRLAVAARRCRYSGVNKTHRTATQKPANHKSSSGGLNGAG